MAESWDAEPPPRLEAAQGIDWPLKVSAVFVLLGWLPASGYAALLGVGFFGPLALPAIAAMIGMLFAAIGLLRAVDTGDKRTRAWSIALGALAFVRLFVQPMFG